MSGEEEPFDRKSGRKFWFIIPDWQFRIIDVKFQLTIYAYFGGLACLVIGIVAYWTKGLTNYIGSMEFFYLIISVVTSFLIFAAVLSHKLIGPIFNVKKHMKITREEGIMTPVQLRKDDFFLDLAEEYNNLIKYFTNKN